MSALATNGAAVIHDFEVPDLKPFRVSTPVLSDVRESAEDGTPGDRLAIAALTGIAGVAWYEAYKFLRPRGAKE